MTAELPRARRPVASIVMPTHGAWEWTSRALEAVREHTDVPYEVIVCDNASRDETRQRLATASGVRVVLNSRNRGFGTACNQGAALARAPYVVFLNSDAIAHDGWLAPLVEQLDSDPAVGAVGPQLLNTDGSIQEAGSTVLGDAMTISHGGGSADFGFPRTVDYVSGSCLATRRSTFHEAGGFDAAFGLGYFEDTDLCYRLRSLGYRIVYEPASVLTHGRGASSDKEVQDELVVRNQRLFLARWKHELAGRPSYDESRELDPASSRDLSAAARLLVLPARSANETCELAAKLVALLPDARVTVLGDAATGLPRAVERVSPADSAAMLRRRRFHFDVVLLPSPADDEELGRALDETQPQAARVVAADADLPHALAKTGVT